MKEKELAEMDDWNSRRPSCDSKSMIARLIAEVRRLKAENEQMAINHEREIARMNGVLDGFDL